MKIKNRRRVTTTLMVFLASTINSWAMERTNGELTEEQKRLDKMLFQAVFARNTEAVRDALQAGAQVNAKNQHGETPLALAAEVNDVSFINLLLDHNAAVEVHDKDGITPLMVAAHYGNTAVEQILLKKIEDNTITLSKRELKELSEHEVMSHTKELFCVMAGQKRIRWRAFEEIDQALFSGADVNASDKVGNTPLIMAVRQGDADIMHILLDNKADVHAKNKKGYTPLLIACSQGHKDAIALLLEYKADVNGKKSGNTEGIPLIVAAGNGFASCVKVLLDGKADVHVQVDGGCTALMKASRNGHVDTVVLLISYKAQPDAQNIWEETPLMWAARGGHIQTMQLLIDGKADVNAGDKFHKRAPLVWAAKEGHSAAVEFLLNNKANVNPLPVLWGNNPLIEAASYGHSEIVKLLLDKGADSGVKGKSDCSSTGYIEGSPLIHAAANGHGEVVKLLIEKQADVCAVDTKNKTALSYAAAKGHKSVVTLLLGNSANQHDQARQQEIMSVLGDAIKNDHYEVAHLLVLAGADFRCVNADGVALWQLASQKMKWTLLAAEKERRIAKYTYVGQSAERAIHFLETRYPLTPPSAIASRGQQRTFSSRPLVRVMARNTTVQSLLHSKNKSTRRAAISAAAGIALIKALDNTVAVDRV